MMKSLYIYKYIILYLFSFYDFEILTEIITITNTITITNDEKKKISFYSILNYKNAIRK
jgi:hypothetical protein